MAVENGPHGMYRMKPLYDPRTQVELPTCMYQLKCLYAGQDTERRETEARMTDEPDAESETRLSNVLKKLEDIKSEVLSLKKNVQLSEGRANKGNDNVSAKKSKETKAVPAMALSCDVNQSFKPQEIVIKANPDYPPYSVWAFLYLLKGSLKTQLVTYTHSTLKHLPEQVKRLSSSRNDGTFDLTLTVIWKDTGKNPEMMVDPLHQGIIEAEVNIARYLSRLISSGYDSDPAEAFQVDYWLEVAHTMLIHGSNKERNSALKTLNSHLAKSSYLLGNALSVADLVMWSTLVQCKLHLDLPAHVDKWWKILAEIPMFKNIICI